MVMDALRRKLSAGELLLLDGATGTELERRGAQMSRSAWCALATSTDPGTLLGIHEDYIRAGSDVITANTFSNAHHMLEQAGCGDRAPELTRQAVEIALRARDRAADGRDVAVAVSLSHQMPMVAGAARDDPERRPEPERVLDNFREVLNSGRDAGADMIMLEMMSRPIHIALALQAAEECGLPYWCGMSARMEEDKVLSYVWESFPFEESVASVMQGGAEVVGIMHTNVNATGPALDILRAAWKGPMMAYPDSGFFKMPSWQFTDIIELDDLADEAQTWRDRGVQVFGGCCGLGLEHIRTLAALRH
ncbi:MAG: homocysteine S-methyltransferase family protein [Rhodospirillales bacterium]|nr:homocysteine S-methyltransferase family protein [Rhodospirillales bacterium]